MSNIKNDLFRVLERAQQLSQAPAAASRTSGANMGGGGASGTPRGAAGVGMSVSSGIMNSGNDSESHVTQPIVTDGIVSTRNTLYWGMDNWGEATWG